MIYIVTYATHNERYFDILKKSCPDLIILGYGKPWNGFSDKVNATLDFCKSKNPDDIICFVDGFDSVILSSKEEILKKYMEFNVPLVFSKDCYTPNTIIKYFKDKIFSGTCKDEYINSGLYIGKVTDIIHFWENIKEGEDDQSYATKTCKNNKENIIVDTQYKLFYNYYIGSEYRIENNKLYVGNEIPSIISCPGYKNINHILEKLNYNNLPNIKVKHNVVLRKIKEYGKEFIGEAIVFILILFICFKDWNIYIKAIIIIILISCLLEYELYLKQLDISFMKKMVFLLVDVIHILFFFFLVYLVINFNCNIPKLLLLNIVFFTHIGLFFYFRQCLITIISNNIIDNGENRKWMAPFKRFYYFLNLNTKYEPGKNSPDIEWIKGNIPFISIIILLNGYCLWKTYNGGNCVPKNGYGKIDFIKPLRNMFK